MYCVLCCSGLGHPSRGEALSGLLPFEDGNVEVEDGEGARGKRKELGVEETAAVQVARQTSSLMALLNSQDLAGTAAKVTRVWLGEGLGTVSKRTYEKMMRWEFVDLGEFQPKALVEKGSSEAETEKLVVLPGFEVERNPSATF